MSLVSHVPIDMLEYLRSQLNRLFESDLMPLWMGDDGNVVTSNWVPRVDVREEADRYVFLADIPGVDSRDIEVTAANGILAIKGERKSESREERTGYKRIERAQGMFYRRFSLPAARMVFWNWLSPNMKKLSHARSRSRVENGYFVESPGFFW
jgi:HSP20 family protein